MIWRIMRAILAPCVIFCAFLGATALRAEAAQDPRLSTLCYNAIDVVSRRSGVPREVMLAISLTETGRKMDGDIRPWPWTVNMEGKGEWFDTRDQALTYVKRHFTRGARSFDVGCFQINYKWHHQHFSSIDAMFDPMINTTYAARYLTELYAEKGNWPEAAGAYHSRTPKYATKYAKRFVRYIKRLTDNPNIAVFTGHGSEELQLAEAAPPGPLPTKRWQPIINISPAERLISPNKAPRGSLFNTNTTATPLLRRSAGSLY